MGSRLSKEGRWQHHVKPPRPSNGTPHPVTLDGMPRPRPPLGQHFLHDQEVLERIASSLPIEPDSLVVEIGSGQGALTRQLLERGARVAAIEVDRELAAGLRERFSDAAALEVIEGDVLDVDLTELIRSQLDRPALVAGNLPYYITSPILRRVFAASAAVKQAVFLMQKEVAERVVAVKGSRDYGFLSVLSRLHADPELLFTVAPGCFQPPPQVTSAVVRLVMRVGSEPEPDLVDFLKICFSHPRKTLLNNLAAKYERSRVATLQEAGRRAQELDLEELQEAWHTLK